MTKDNTTTGQRLKQFAVQQFGSVSALCKVLDMTPQGLSSYINGRSKPGAAIQEKLRNAGCDIEWLMTGEKKEQSANVVKKLSTEQDVYIKVLETEVKYLREKVATYEEYLNFSKDKKS